MKKFSVEQSDGTYTDTVGFMNVGGILFARAKLVTTLPDFRRFERWLETAARANDYMSEHGGAIPPWLQGKPAREINDIAETMREVGKLQSDASAELIAELKRRGPAGR